MISHRMIKEFFYSLTVVGYAIGAGLVLGAMLIIAFFVYEHPGLATVETETPPVVSTVVATSSLAIASTTLAPTVLETPIVQKKATEMPPTVVHPPTPPAPPIIEPISTSTENRTVGTTTLAVQSIPLLFGGTAHAGGLVPVSYLQMTNVGTEGAVLSGFWIKQNGTASTLSVIGLSTVDDRGGSRGSAGGSEGQTPFKDGFAFAPTDAYFAPGQMRLFTIKALLTNNVSAYVGTQLKIDVTAIETTATTIATFPIQGTTWTIDL